MTADGTKRYLTVRRLYPKPGRRDEIIAAVKKVSEAARKHEGLVEIGGWLDEANDRIVNISLWESEEAAVKARETMHAALGDIPCGEWERKPAENYLGLKRVV